MSASPLSSENEAKEHQYQSLAEAGTRGAYESRKVNGGLYVRVDMPGVPPESVKLTKRGEAHTVTFTGKTTEQWADSSMNYNRVYGGYVVLDCNPNEVDIEMTLVNGSLKLFFPNADGLLHYFPSNNRVPRESIVNAFTETHMNPFLLDGVKGVIHGDQVFDATTGLVLVYYRVDMPGVGEQKKAHVQIKDSATVFFNGEGSEEHRFDEGKRSYFGGMALVCTCCNFIHVKHITMKHGVLMFSVLRSCSGMKCDIGLLCPAGSPSIDYIPE